MPINKGMNKEDVVHVDNGILPSHFFKKKVMPFGATPMETSGFFWTQAPLTSYTSSTSKC